MGLVSSACFRNEKSYPFLPDARAALEARDADRAYGAAQAALDGSGTLELSESEQSEARVIAARASALVAEQRLARARALPRTREGLVERMALLAPVLTESALSAMHEPARVEIADTLLALWDAGEAEIRRENYAVVLDAIARYRTFVPEGHPLTKRIAAQRARAAKDHEARAAEAPDDDTGLAMKRYHLARATALGAPHQAEVDRLGAALQRAVGVAYEVTKIEAEGDCASEKTAISNAIVAPGKHPIEIVLAVRGCAVSRDISTSTQTRSYDVPVKRKRMVEVPVVDGYVSQKSTSDKTLCWGNAKNGGRTCTTETTTTTTPVAQVHYELQPYEETVYETRQTTYPVSTKTKRAKLTIEVKASFDGQTKSFVATGEDEFRDTQVSGDSGGAGKSFGPERANAAMLASARADALSKAVAFVRSLGPQRLALALDAYDRGAAGDPVREEAAHAVVLWSLAGGPRHDRSKAWLGERWGERAPEGALAASVEAFKAPFRELPFGDYPHDTPTRPSYFNVAQGVGYLVTRGLSFETTLKQASLDRDRAQLTAGATFAFGGKVDALRLGALGASSSIAGDVYGYALGASYARSLRGEVSEKHRASVVASVGAEAGALWLDGGAAGSIAKERFLRAPLAVHVGVPFYVVTLQGSLAFAPNILGLGDNDGFRSIHPLSAWLGLAPVPWVVLDGGVELPLGAAEVSPRFAARLGLRL